LRRLAQHDKQNHGTGRVQKTAESTILSGSGFYIGNGLEEFRATLP